MRTFICACLSFVSLHSITHHTTYRSDGSEIIWHLSLPQKEPYTLVVLSEGSYEAFAKTKSVLHLHKIFEPLLVPRGFGLITIEKWGVTPEGVDTQAFHEHNTRSQRIADHKTVLDALQVQGLTGLMTRCTYVFIGGSEGGDIMIELMAHYADRTRAGINFAGAGAHGAYGEIWACVQQMRIEGSCLTRLYMWWESIPKTYAEYNKQIDMMCADPSPEKWWFGQTYRYWADAFTRTVDFERIYASKIPLLVIMGTKDSGIASCDIFVERAKERGVPITYWRIDDMGHSVSKSRPVLFEQSIDWLCSLTR